LDHFSFAIRALSFNQMIQEFGIYFAFMLVLTAASAFCSCAEAAMFSLQGDDRRALRRGNAAQRTAIELLGRPDRLLTAILFWNLVFNFGFFIVGSVVEYRLHEQSRHTESAILMVASLLGMIVLGEMLPKTIGVQQPKVFAGLTALPMAALVRTLDPVMPIVAAANNMLQRLLFPNFEREPYLEISDLERAIELSTDDAQLAALEQSALRNIVLLSELPAEELMRPRNQYEAFRAPVHLEHLAGKLPPSGYLLITDEESDDISAAISLKHLAAIPRHHLEQSAQPVVYVPWCATVAAILDELRRQEREVAAVVNEYGETIGIVTIEDVMETIFEDQSSRSARLLATSSIIPVAPDRWHVTGMTNLRRLSRHFDVPLESSRSVTVAGILQEQLQRIPVEGDELLWSGFHFCVLDAEESGAVKVELRVPPAGGPLP
jgi:CBS domain containing-hemolysin-like protein